MSANASDIPELLVPALAQPSVQRAFPWQRHSWARLERFAHVSDALDSLPAELDREATRRVVQDQLAKQQTAGAFVAAMVWGYGTTGYGPARTERVITGSRGHGDQSPVFERNLLESAEIAHSDGAVAAYRYLNNEGHLPYLGPAFFTKWLYFITATHGAADRDAAPILDAQVIRWLSSHSNLHLRPGLTADYERYISTLREWGAAHDLSPAEVKREIFGLATGR